MYKFQAILWIILSLKCSISEYIIKTPKRCIDCHHFSFHSLWVVETSKFNAFLIEKGVTKCLALIAPVGRKGLAKVSNLARGH